MDSAIVVGAGVFGASLAWVLSRQGVSVTLIDQFEPGDDRSSSGGETRLMRASHGIDEEYTRMSRRSRELWRELEADSGEELLAETGVVWFAHSEDGWEAHSQRTLEAEGVPVERLSIPDAARLFPSFDGADLLFALLEPEAGVLRAERGVRALVRQAEAEGARVVRARAQPRDGGVELDDGRTLEAGAVAWACGPWLGQLFPGVVSLRVTRQDLFFVEGGPGWGGAPGWVDYDLAMYGTGDVDGFGVKFAPDGEGPEISPDAELPPADPENERLAREYAARRFPALAGATLTRSRTCRYELSGDTNFIVGRHPGQPETWLVGGGSGHGFKHGPALAERVADAMRSGAALPDRFALGERVPGRSLRTAGSSGEAGP